MILRVAGLLTATVLIGGSQPDPQLQMWVNIKRQLSGLSGESYFEKALSDAELPVLSGGIVRSLLNDGISKLEVGIEDPKRTDAVLVVHHASYRIKEPLNAGSRLTFKGVAVSFTRNPVVVTFETDRADVTGLRYEKLQP